MKKAGWMFSIFILMTTACSLPIALPGINTISATETLPVLTATVEAFSDPTGSIPEGTAPPDSAPGIGSFEVPEEGNKAVYTYKLQAGSPAYITNFSHPERACGYMGVGGQIFDSDGSPISQLAVMIKGTLNGIPITRFGVTGESTAFGPGGYEIILSRRPIASSQTLTVSVIGPTGAIASSPITITTYQDCTKNLLIINYKK